MGIYIRRQAFIAEPLDGVARGETSLGFPGSLLGSAHGGGDGTPRLHPWRASTVFSSYHKAATAARTSSARSRYQQ